MERMVEVLKLLAASCAVQKSALPPFVVAADEIALLYDEEFQTLKGGNLWSGIGADLRADLLAIDEELESMSDDQTLWTDDALGADPKWQALRTRTQEALHSLGQPLEPPRLSWLTLVGP